MALRTQNIDMTKELREVKSRQESEESDEYVS